MTAWKRGTLRRQCPYDLQEDWAGDRAHVLSALPQDTPAPAIFTDGHSLVFKGHLVQLPVPGQKSSSSVSADDTVSSGVVPLPARLSQPSELPQPQQQGCSPPPCGRPRPSSGPVPSPPRQRRGRALSCPASRVSPASGGRPAVGSAGSTGCGAARPPQRSRQGSVCGSSVPDWRRARPRRAERVLGSGR